MSISSSIKGAGAVIGGLAVMLGLAVVGIALLVGATAFSMWVMKWTFPAFAITLLVSVVVLVPLSLIPPSRGFSAIGFMIASLAFGAILWIWAMAYTLSVWSFLGVVVGLFIFGVGVVPVAMLAALLHGDWGNLGLFLATGAFTFGYRVLAHWLCGES